MLLVMLSRRHCVEAVVMRALGPALVPRSMDVARYRVLNVTHGASVLPPLVEPLLWLSLLFITNGSLSFCTG